MLTKRIIPCLDVKEGRVVKGVSFVVAVMGLFGIGELSHSLESFIQHSADTGTVPDAGRTTASSASSISAAVWYRSEISTASPRAMIGSSAWTCPR